MVAGDHQRRAVGHHAHGQAEDPGRVGATVDEVAEEHGPAPVGVAGGAAVRRHLAAEPTQQGHQLVGAPVDVAHQVERAGVVTAVDYSRSAQPPRRRRPR